MDENNPEQWTVANLAPRVRSGDISPVELTRLCLERIERLNPKLNAYLTVTAESALASAETAEREIREGGYRGPLHGMPFSIKDNIAIRGVRTTAGSKTLADWIPDFDATVVTRLRQAGVVILGKTQMHEWAKGSHGINPFFGTPYNPWDTNRIPGGSSSGSGVAVAGSLCFGSIGTDAAGSVRNPASLCGVVGLKPTYGRVSVFGGVPGTGGYSHNHFGILAKSVEDAALVLQAIAGHDPKDPLSSSQPVQDYSRSIGKDVKGFRVGVVDGYFEAFLAREVKDVFGAAVREIESLGMAVETVSIPHIALVPAVQLCTSRAESTPDHERYLRTRPRDYSKSMLATQICALTVPASAYVTAQRVRRLIGKDFQNALDKVDVLVAPTTPVPAPTIAESKQGFVAVDGKKIYFQNDRGNFLTMCTIPFNVTGLPAISVCCGFSASGLPIGMQIVGRSFEEDKVLQVAYAYERSAPWRDRHPKLPPPEESASGPGL